MLIDTKMFYKTGFWAFLIVAICSTVNFFIYFELQNFFSRVSSLAQVVFNFVLAGFFYYLLKTQTSSIPDETEEEINEDIKAFENGFK